MTTPKIEDRVSDEQQELTIEADEQAEPTEETPAADTSRRGRLPAVALLVAAVLVMGSGLFAWWQAAGDEDIARAETRDAALIAGRQHIETIQSLDYREIDKGLKAWNEITTGTMNDQIKAITEEDRKLLADQKKISTTKVIDAAVLDLEETTATVIAAVEITVADDPAANIEPTVKRNRYSAGLVLVRGSWKLENIQPVPVDLS